MQHLSIEFTRIDWELIDTTGGIYQHSDVYISIGLSLPLTFELPAGIVIYISMVNQVIFGLDYGWCL